jgi:flagellar hook-length control protein FliK
MSAIQLLPPDPQGLSANGAADPPVASGADSADASTGNRSFDNFLSNAVNPPASVAPPSDSNSPEAGAPALAVGNCSPGGGDANAAAPVPMTQFPLPGQPSSSSPNPRIAAPVRGADVKINAQSDPGATTTAGNTTLLETDKTAPADGEAAASAVVPPPECPASAAPVHFAKMLLQDTSTDAPQDDASPVAGAAADHPTPVTPQLSDDKPILQVAALTKADSVSSGPDADPQFFAANLSRSVDPLFVQATGGSTVSIIDPPPPPEPVPGAAPAQLIKTLLQVTILAADGDKADRSAPLPGTSDDSSPGPSGTIPPALIAALNLTPVLPAATATPPDRSQPATTPRATMVGNPVLSVHETISVAASKEIASRSATLVTVVSATAAATGDEMPDDPVPPVNQATGPTIEKSAPTAAGNGPTTAVDQVSLAGVPPVIENSSQLSLVLSAGQPTVQFEPVTQIAGSSATAPAIAVAPLGTPADSLPFSAAPVTAAAAELKPAISTASDNDGASQSADITDTAPDTTSAATINRHSPLFAAAPALLQAHAANYISVQPGNAGALHPAQVIEQAGWALQATYSSGQEMQLQLSPPDLGLLQVSVSVRDGVLSARLEAQNPATRQILADNLPQLKDSLTQQGLAFDRIDVQLAGSSTGWSGSGAGDASFGRQQEGNVPWDQVQAFAPSESNEPLPSQAGLRGPVSRTPLTSLDVMV